MAVGTQTFEIGTTTITYTAEDPSGNDVTAVVTVEVADDEDPTVAAAANVTANTGDNDPGDWMQKLRSLTQHSQITVPVQP